jgi:hypothetical protein
MPNAAGQGIVPEIEGSRAGVWIIDIGMAQRHFDFMKRVFHKPLASPASTMVSDACSEHPAMRFAKRRAAWIRSIRVLLRFAVSPLA